MEDNWTFPNAYDSFMGRWSRLVARKFVGWLEPRPQFHWLELGCGTGALTSAILGAADPASILACDPSGSLLELARRQVSDPRVTFTTGSAEDLPGVAHPLDVFVSGLVLNFVPDPGAALEAILPLLASGGLVGGYVWDYSEGMEFLRVFWDAAVAIDSNAVGLDEGVRFPLCAPGPLRSLFESAGLKDVEVASLEITTGFADFSDYWAPFLGGTGAAPTYVASLGPEARKELKENLRQRLTPGGDQSFDLVARAWAVRGISTVGEKRR